MGTIIVATTVNPITATSAKTATSTIFMRTAAIFTTTSSLSTTTIKIRQDKK